MRALVSLLVLLTFVVQAWSEAFARDEARYSSDLRRCTGIPALQEADGPASCCCRRCETRGCCAKPLPVRTPRTPMLPVSVPPPSSADLLPPPLLPSAAFVSLAFPPPLPPPASLPRVPASRGVLDVLQRDCVLLI